MMMGSRRRLAPTLPKPVRHLKPTKTLIPNSCTVREVSRPVGATTLDPIQHLHHPHVRRRLSLVSQKSSASPTSPYCT